MVRKETDRKNEIAAAVNATNPLSVASIETLVETLDGLDRFTHADSLLLVDRQLQVRQIVPTSADVATVAGLDKYTIHDFQNRIAALSKSRVE